MLFYMIGPFMVAGMSWKEPFIALGVVPRLGHLRRYLLRPEKLEAGQADLSHRQAGLA